MDRECYKCKYYLNEGLSMFCENKEADRLIRDSGMRLYLNREHSSKPIAPEWAYAGCMNESKQCHWFLPKNIFKRFAYWITGQDVGGDMKLEPPKWAMEKSAVGGH